jgi:membrane protease YdiL (CAAX protease family)
MITSRLTQSFPKTIANQMSILIATLLTLVLVYVFTRWQKLRLSDVGVVPGSASIPRFFTGYAIGIMLAVGQALIVLASGHFQLVLQSNLSVATVVLPLMLYLLVACREELAFRSFGLHALRISYSPTFALVFITVIFIAEHVLSGMTWTMSIVGSGLGGVLFGVAALKTRGLALPLGLHSAWNFGQWMMGFKGEAGIWQAVVQPGFEKRAELIGLIAFAGLMILAIAGVFMYYRKPIVAN